MSEWYLVEPENNCDCKNCIEELGDCLYIQVDGKWVLMEEKEMNKEYEKKETKKHSGVWCGQVQRTMVGDVPMDIVKQGSDAILSWLWENGEQQEDELADDWEPPFEPEESDEQ